MNIMVVVEVHNARFWLILAKIQHSRVPTYNLAQNSYSGLAAGKGLTDKGSDRIKKLPPRRIPTVGIVPKVP